MIAKPVPSDLPRRLRHWRVTIKAIQRRLCNLLADRKLYKTWRGIIDENDKLDKSNAYLWLFENNYWNNLLVGIRTFDDTDRRSHSLRNLICEISEHSHLLTKEWFCRRFSARLRKGGMDKLQFERDWSGRRTISKQRICRDLAQLLRECKSVRLVVNRHIAHNARKRRGKVTRGEVDATLDTMFSLVKRYYVLLLNSDLGHPVDMTANPRIFDVPWRQPGGAL